MPFVDHTLDGEQKKAVESILLRKYGTLLFLISGPPGTGNTKTLAVEAVQGLEFGVVILCATCTTEQFVRHDRHDRRMARGLLRMSGALNVALTRAKYGLAVVDYCELLLGADPNRKAFFEFSGRNGLVARTADAGKVGENGGLQGLPTGSGEEEGTRAKQPDPSRDEPDMVNGDDQLRKLVPHYHNDDEGRLFVHPGVRYGNCMAWYSTALKPVKVIKIGKKVHRSFIKGSLRAREKDEPEKESMVLYGNQERKKNWY
ncbi:hypothetical protein BD289DRAFT_487101 [Coniella lustricola]|uniref:DNA2/NAM7 helicase-like C-terminal domain-containing protein n=1 Tax=Coniella lustricola TaxID=2025994 RepID=A0A2T2ZSW0_9PEZI|nr:hypothetical protein BD289DRAFT_487101 [Coniella lustricola]